MKNPEEIRRKIRAREIIGPTSGIAEGFAQANLVILPEKYAFDFLLFTQRNPKPCPLLEVLEKGQYLTRIIADAGDIRTDVPKYRVYENGKVVDEPLDIISYWRDDFVSFLLGCSFSFEWALIEAGIPIRHIEANRNVPMYKTNIKTNEAGIFHGPLVVSMRAIPSSMVAKACNITAYYPAVHGAPVHVGNPEMIGIDDLQSPDYGDPPVIKEGDELIFWACGVTPQAVAIESGVEFMITHSPGHMFITDIKNKDLALL